jgi:prepilin-type N-terminal cleavage/methylation domain-containing protein
VVDTCRAPDAGSIPPLGKGGHGGFLGDTVKLKRWDKTGFTLIELILATAISALVVGILSVCFSFALRVWQSTQNQKPDHTFQLADLLNRQLAECDPKPIKFKDSVHPLFAGQSNSIAFVTTHSVKAISQGVPVVARYTYDPNSRVLNYSELLLDPYHVDFIERFLAGRASSEKETRIRAYGVEFPEFVLAYAGKDSREFLKAWDKVEELPVEVLLRWRGNDSMVHARVCMVNGLFSIEVPKASLPGAGGVGLNTGLNQ